MSYNVASKRIPDIERLIGKFQDMSNRYPPDERFKLHDLVSGVVKVLDEYKWNIEEDENNQESHLGIIDRMYMPQIISKIKDIYAEKKYLDYMCCVRRELMKVQAIENNVSSDQRLSITERYLQKAKSILDDLLKKIMSSDNADIDSLRLDYEPIKDRMMAEFYGEKERLEKLCLLKNERIGLHFFKKRLSDTHYGQGAISGFDDQISVITECIDALESLPERTDINYVDVLANYDPLLVKSRKKFSDSISSE